MRPVKAARKALYWSMEHICDLPGGPLRYMWLVRLLLKLDAPLRNSLLRGIHAERAIR
jgi:hypothetical protein